MDNLYSALFTKEALFLSLAIVGFLYFLGKIPVKNVKTKNTKYLKDNKVWRRILPLLPLVLGVGVAFAPGVSQLPKEEWGSIIVFGVWCGFVASHGRKIIKRGILDKLKDQNE